MDISKLTYLLESTLQITQKKACKYCGSTKIKAVDNKYVVMKLLQCQDCNFQFRFPADNVAESNKFYQFNYIQKGLTTDLPSDEELNKLLSSNFENTPKDFSNHIKQLLHLTNSKSKPHVLDYGANWGYTSLQFQKAGFDVTSFEISQPRAKYGKEKLGIDIITNTDEIQGEFDIIFSSHVIEHLPDVNEFVRFSRKHLKKDGVFVAYSPNGSRNFRMANPRLFHRFWGKVHPNLISAEFYSSVFANNPFIITSNADIDALYSWDKDSQALGNLVSDELIIACYPNRKVEVASLVEE